MSKLGILSIFFFTTTNVIAQSTCPSSSSVKLTCEQGIWHTQIGALPNDFRKGANDFEGKSCEDNNATLTFKKGFEFTEGLGLSCIYGIAHSNNGQEIYLNTDNYKHVGDNWTFDYLWRWTCLSYDVNDCPIKHFRGA